MKQFYKCDFCFHIEEDAERMQKHEESCRSNPANKACWSCKHHSQEWDCHFCAAKCPDFSCSEKVNCEKWEREDD